MVAAALNLRIPLAEAAHSREPGQRQTRPVQNSGRNYSDLTSDDASRTERNLQWLPRMDSNHDKVIQS